MAMTKRERERVLTIIETAVVVLLALVAAWRLDVDIDKIASISADQWILIATGVGGVVVAVRNAWRESVRRVPAIAERETPVEPRRPEEGMTHPETLAWVLCYALLAGLALSRALAHVGAVLLVVVAAAGLTGCGASALRVHAGVASTLGATLDQACEEVETGRARALDGCAGEPDADADAACLARERARYAEAVDGCGATKTVHDAWADEIVEGASRDTWTWEDGLPLVVRMLDVAMRLVPHLEALGVHVDLGPLAALAARGAP